MMIDVTVDDLARHWDNSYELGDTTRSWFQDEPTASLRMLDAAGVSSTDGVIDVGGGASTLVDALLHRGFDELTVLDISAAGLDAARRRLGDAAVRVHWIVTDLLAWTAPRTFAVWHDRAVFHFLTEAHDREQYLHNLNAATAPGAVAIIGCFALDGPQSCSGLPVARYDAVGLAEQLGDDWALKGAERQEHATPIGAVQHFTWAAFRRQR